MSDTATANPFDAYVASLFAALGSRDPIEVMREGPSSFKAAIGGMTTAQLATPERAGKWSVLQVIQHLADAELVGGFRFRMVLAHDRPELPGYDQDLWAERLRYSESNIETALEEFSTLRRSNVRLLERATSSDRQRTMSHSERGDESLDKLIHMYAGHDLVHLRQIARIRAAIGA
jgi:hypothetical protein